MEYDFKDSLECLNYIATVIGILFGVWTFYTSKQREKKKDTITDYTELKKHVADFEAKICENQHIKSVTKENNLELWKMCSSYLMNIEYFCTGVNNGIYDYKIIDQVGGQYFLDQYELLKPVILQKRKNNSQNYIEFEKVVVKIKKHRVKTLELYQEDK